MPDHTINELRRRIALCVALLLIGACSEQSRSSVDDVQNSRIGEPDFVGSAACQSCHTAEFSDWQTSHHRAAMQPATPDTVLGDFSNTFFEYFSTRAEFRRDGERFLVRTENANGELQDFDVTHTFGIEPLQQYLVEFPGGRKQALPFLWDARSVEDGGQRWFHLYPDEYIEPGDELHWTGPNFNWNYSCAECHSTNLEMGYDVENDTFNTTWSEISVGCEACHGPASGHVQQANGEDFDAALGLQLSLDDQHGAAWVMNIASGVAKRSVPMNKPQLQPETCGRCHSRRSVLAPNYEYGRPLTATHMPALLDEGLYFPNGQIRDEVYVYGSFLQSRMYQAGVTCSDCHNPHSGSLKTGPDPDAVCAQCHLPAKFATTNHYGESGEITQCVDCHMTSRTYMGVDARRDHFFRIPTDDTLRAKTFAASTDGSVDDALVHIADSPDIPAIVRATALIRLDQAQSAASVTAIRTGLASSDPLLRLGALRALQRLPAAVRNLDGLSLLSDPIRGVRHQAAITYADVSDLFDANTNRAFQIAADEVRETYQHSGSRAESNVALGDFESALGQRTVAIAHYRHALQLNPNFAPAYLNLADLQRRAGDLKGAETLIRDGIQRLPESAALHHSLGLIISSVGDTNGALASLRRATELAPGNGRYAYVFAVAQNSYGQHDEALVNIKAAYQQFPNDFDIGWALATMLRDAGQLESAQDVALELQKRSPDDQRAIALLEALR